MLSSQVISEQVFARQSQWAPVGLVKCDGICATATDINVANKMMENFMMEDLVSHWINPINCLSLLSLVWHEAKNLNKKRIKSHLFFSDIEFHQLHATNKTQNTCWNCYFSINWQNARFRLQYLAWIKWIKERKGLNEGRLMIFFWF